MVALKNQRMLENEKKNVLYLQVFLSPIFFFISGNGAQFQITVLTTTANTGATPSGFDLLYAQVGC